MTIELASPLEENPVGVNVLIMGPTGTGKTWSLGTIADWRPEKKPDTFLDLHYFAFEAGKESLVGYWTDQGKPLPSNVFFHTVKTASAGWTEMAESAKAVNTLSYELLKKSTDPNRNKYDQFEQFLRNFIVTKDDTGTNHGSVDSWGTNKVIAIDGLTGLGNSALAAVIGGKADRDQKDWGLAQNMVEGALRRLCDACRCHFILLGHVEREPDPLGGPAKITVSTLGKALAPKIPPMFSDVALAKRVKTTWTWDTEDPGADLKARNLPIHGGIPQNFGIILNKWISRGGKIVSGEDLKAT
jgi:hypothetical protein